MKKYLSAFFAAAVFMVCCMAGINAYAATDISNADVQLSSVSSIYTGSQIKPDVVSVTVDDVALSANDYTVSYKDNINAGTATVSVKGVNEYSGTATAEFTISPRAISSASVASFYVYAGKTPTVSVSYNSKSLKKNTDFTLSVSNNAKAGKTASIVLTGKGNFTGTKKISKVVLPNTVSGFSSSNRKTNSFTLKFKSLSGEGVTGYAVYKCDSKGNNLKHYKNVKSNSAAISGYKAGEYAYIKVRAYVTVNGKNYYGNYSKVYKTCAKPATVTLNSVTKSKDNKKFTVKWAKTGCTGYQIQYSTDKNFKKGVKTVTVKNASNVSKTISYSTKKTVYARVRAFRQFTYNGSKKTVYGAYSVKLSTNYSKVYASYTTSYVNNANRTTNLKLACKAINGTIVAPGKTFSFNKVVGKRTAAKGYKPATIFTGGSSTAQSTGGGICQVASTMFNAALLGNLGIAERHQHSQRVSYCPLGRDAAIYWGSEDFKFKNTTKYPIKISAKCSNGKLTIKYYVSYDVSPKKVKLNVTKKGNTFTLKRSVGGKVNYTCKSTY
ncbi:MAG: VanW family protein [Eubacterium sp.]